MNLGCDYVSLPVEDLQEAVRFYGEALGLSLLFERPRRWAEFDQQTGRGRLARFQDPSMNQLELVQQRSAAL